MIRSLSTAALLTAALLASPAGATINDDPGGPGGGGGGGNDPGGGGPQEPVPPIPGYWSTSFTDYDYWGSDNWGAGYTIGGSLSATPKQTATGKDKLTAQASAKATAKINGSTKNLLEVRLVGLTEAKGRTDLTLTGYVAGAAVFSRPFVSISSTKTTATMTPINWPKTFFDLSTTVEVGFVPVTFRAKATGEIRANITGEISNVGLEVASTPSAKASLYASAAVGGQYCKLNICVGASAGVYADVTLIEVAAPALMKIWWSLAQPTAGVKLDYALDADLTIKSLDGELGVFAEACIGECWRRDLTLIDWDGFEAIFSLFDDHGFYCLSGTCSTPVPTPRGVY